MAAADCDTSSIGRSGPMAASGSEAGRKSDPVRPSANASGIAAFLRRRGGIGRRLLALILLASSAITLVITLGQLYFDYRRDVSAIETRLAEVETAYLESVAGSLWHVDKLQLQIQLDGIVRLPDMAHAEVLDAMANSERGSMASAVSKRGQAAIARQYPIVYNDRGTLRTIGTLNVAATLDEVYRRLADKAAVILLSQGVKTFLISFFILYIVHRLVTRHLAAIAKFAESYDVRFPAPALNLTRSKPRHEDELDSVVASFNHMTASLERAYRDLRLTNEELEQDILARRRAEEEVNRLNADLERRVEQRTADLEAANAELSAFAYSVSHDLRAPLRRIEGFGKMLAEDYADRLDEKAIHYLDRIRAGSRELGEMIDSFLKLSRATRGDLAIERVDLASLARETAAQLAEREPDRTVTVEIDPHLTIDGDRRLLKSAMHNLIENAWKYTRRTDRPEIRVGAKIDGIQTVFFVADNGAGFDMKLAERLFMPFNRLHKPDEFEGSGIGLATVQRILARHGGRIWAEAEPGRGATFYFTCWDGRNADA